MRVHVSCVTSPGYSFSFICESVWEILEKVCSPLVFTGLRSSYGAAQRKKPVRNLNGFCATFQLLLHIDEKCLWGWVLGEKKDLCLALRSYDRARKRRKCDSFQSLYLCVWCEALRAHADSLPVEVMERE